MVKMLTLESVGQQYPYAKELFIDSENSDLSRCLNNTVIASQCAHWRGNPPDFQTFFVKNTIDTGKIRRLPHQ